MENPLFLSVLFPRTRSVILEVVPAFQKHFLACNSIAFCTISNDSSKSKTYKYKETKKKNIARKTLYLQLFNS